MAVKLPKYQFQKFANLVSSRRSHCPGFCWLPGNLSTDSHWGNVILLFPESLILQKHPYPPSPSLQTNSSSRLSYPPLYITTTTTQDIPSKSFICKLCPMDRLNFVWNMEQLSDLHLDLVKSKQFSFVFFNVICNKSYNSSQLASVFVQSLSLTFDVQMFHIQ